MGTPPSPRKASVGCQDNQYGIKNMNVHYEADTSPNKLGKGNPTGSTISSKGGRSISATPASTISSSATNGPIHSPSSLSSFANSMSLRSGKFQPLSQMLKKRNAPELSAEDTQTLRDEWGGKNLKDVLEQAEDVFSSLDDQGDGILLQSSFSKILGVMGSPMSRLSYLIFSALDENNDGELSYKEFVSWMMVMLQGSFEQKLHFGFRIMDLDKDNVISKHEMVHTLQSLFHLMSGLNIDPPDIDTFVAELFEKCGLEADDEGGISWERYLEMCTKDRNFLKNFGGYSDETNSQKKVDIKSKSGRKVFFGSENWDFMFSVMLGVQLSIDNSRTRPQATDDGGSSNECLSSTVPHAEGLDSYLAKESYDLPSHENSSSSAKVSVTCHYPEIFKQIRETYGVSNESFLESVGVKQVMGCLLMGDLTSMSGLVSEGKSGSFFYYSHDGKYMFKTISTSESNALLSMLSEYTKYVKENPTTLLTRYFGLYRIRFRKVKTHFVVMGNVFHTSLPMDVRFDIKGSMYGRTSLNENLGHFTDSGIIYKDLDWLASGRRLRLGKQITNSLWEQCERDAHFLRDNGVLDYSMLIGIHDSTQSLALTREQFAQENQEVLKDKYEQLTKSGEGGAPPLFASLDYHTFESLAFEHHTQLDEHHARHLVRRFEPKIQPGSGFGPLATMEVNDYCHVTWGESVVFIGIIDTLITFEGIKQAEHLVKAVLHHNKQVSVVPPPEYCSRFLKFVRERVLDGFPASSEPSSELSSSFKSLNGSSNSLPTSPGTQHTQIKRHGRKISWSATSNHMVGIVGSKDNVHK